MKSGTIQDATFIESDPGKHGKKKQPVPVDPEPPKATEEKIAETQDKEKAAGKDGKKRMTKEEKREAKIRAAEKKRLRREERRSAKTRRSKDGTWTKKNSASHFGNTYIRSMGGQGGLRSVYLQESYFSACSGSSSLSPFCIG